MSSTLRVTPDQVRQAFAELGDVLSSNARRVGAALVNCLDWSTWTSPDQRQQEPGWSGGIRRRRLAAFAAYRSVRSVSYGLRELELSGVLQVHNRHHMTHWYALDVGTLLGLALHGRRARRAEPVEAAVEHTEDSEVRVHAQREDPIAMRLDWARELLGNRAPSWALRQDRRRPLDLAAAALVFSRECWGPRQAPELAPAVAGRLQRLRERLGLPLEELLAQLVKVARWAALHQKGLSPHHVLRPSTWARVLPEALQAWESGPPPASPPSPVEPPEQPAEPLEDWLGFAAREWSEFTPLLQRAAALVDDRAVAADVEAALGMPAGWRREAFLADLVRTLTHLRALPERPPTGPPDG